MEDMLLSSVGEYTHLYQVNKQVLRYAAEDVMVMHPGPLNRGIEVDDHSADGAYSAITSQITNGIFVRMAALHWIFSGSEERTEAAGGSKR
jgi:aspartate carbamoyltransferase catalytic subunit